MTGYEFKFTSTDIAGLIQNVSLLSKTSFDKSAAVTPMLDAKGRVMSEVCKMGDALIVLDIFRAYRESAVVVLEVVYVETKDFTATKVSELGRALDREQRNSSYYSLVWHDKVSAALKKGMQLFEKMIEAVTDQVNQDREAEKRRAAEAAHMAAMLKLSQAFVRPVSNSGSGTFQSSKSASVCHHFLRGKCTYGDKCKFAHNSGQQQPQQQQFPAVPHMQHRQVQVRTIINICVVECICKHVDTVFELHTCGLT